MRAIFHGLLLLVAANANAALEPELSIWLDAHPRIRSKMVWSACKLTKASTAHCSTNWDASTCSCRNNSPGVPYDSWPIGLKELLHSAYRMRVSNQFMPVQDPPPVSAQHFQDLVADGSGLRMNDKLSVETVRQLYIAHLAQSLWWEIHRGTWSVATLNDDALDVLFNSVAMFGDPTYGGYLNPGEPWREPAFEQPYKYPVTPGDPAYAYRYLEQRNLIGNTRRETIARVLDWARTQAQHATGSFARIQNRQAQWQYEGSPPVSRILDGTRILDVPNSGINSDNRKISRIPGCHGTTALLNWLLRTVNIPVGVMQADLDKVSHSLTYFMSEDLFLSHGDDYILPKVGRFSATDPFSGALVFGARNEYDMGCLFIDHKTHDEWFVRATRGAAIQNVGRGVTQCVRPAAPSNLRMR